MSFTYYIARRLFQQREATRRLSRPAITIAVWGVAVGLAVMILSLCIVLGFKHEIRDKVMGFGGHVQIVNYQTLLSTESQPLQVDSLWLATLAQHEHVRHVQRFATKSCMLKTNEAFQGVILKGIAQEYDTTFLARHLIAGHLPQFSDSVASNEIVISAKIARQLRLSVGQRVFAYFFSNTVKARRYTVSAIYETYLSEFDDHLIFTDLHDASRLAGWKSDQCAGVEIQIDDIQNLDVTTSELLLCYNHTQDSNGSTRAVFNIFELYPGIFSWLQLLDTNVYIILLLMLGLSLFTMISGLLIIILERTRFIAIMKSLGASNLQLRRIFLYFAIFLIGKGMFFGNLIAIGVALLQQETHFIRLDADTYYLESVPVEISWLLLLFLNIVTLLISAFVLLVPTHLISRIHPAKVMRYE